MMSSSDTLLLHCQVAVRPVDARTGEPTTDGVDAHLEVIDRFGRWQPTDQRPTRTRGGVFAWPGLGLSARPDHARITRYRVHLTASTHRVAWPNEGERLETTAPVFRVRPYGHAAPLPPDTLPEPRVAHLFAASHHRHPAHVPILRGIVRLDGAPLADVVVSHETDRVLSDERGAFGLPLSRAMPGEIAIRAATLDGTHQVRVAMQYPEALRRGAILEIA